MLPRSLRLLLANNNPEVAYSLWEALRADGWDVWYAKSPGEARFLAANEFDLCVVELRLTDSADPHDLTGLHLVRELAAADPQLRFVVTTSYAPTELDAAVLEQLNRTGVRVLTYSYHQSLSELLADVRSAGVARFDAVTKLYKTVDIPSAVIEVVSSIRPTLIDRLRRSPESLYQIHPRAFEELVAELLASHGWSVDLTARTRDGGYDIFAVHKDGSGLLTSCIVECKRYNADRKVGVGVARALYGVKSDLKVGMSLIATTSSFSRDVVAYKASRYDLELKDFTGIVDWINTYQPPVNGRLYLAGNDLLIDKEW